MDPRCKQSFRRLPLGLLITVALTAPRPAAAQTVWGGHGANPQHTALSAAVTRPLQTIRWQTPVDLNPQYSGTSLLIHYASPLITSANTVLVPVKVGATDTFRVEARSGADGSLRWQFLSDYTVPPHTWMPSYQPALTPTGRLYMAGAGGTLFWADDVDTPSIAPTRIAFYGIANYEANPAAYDADIKLCSPITSDTQGNVYFGFRASGANPLGIVGGLARIGADGVGSYVTAQAATNVSGTVPLMNCAPALSPDGITLYAAFRTAQSKGTLVALDAATLAVIARRTLKDPVSGRNANTFDEGTTSPMVAPDGRIFFGITEAPQFENNDRGWLLQFLPSLATAGAPAAFGWDDTPSLVPVTMVPSYAGASPYLIMTKYNDYASSTGDGVNKLAVLDPNDTQIAPLTGATVMKEILTIAGATPDSDHIDTHPNAVKEWCINTAVVDSATHSVLANNEDGKLYRWDLTTNSFPEVITLTPGIGEAYSPTTAGPDGTVYAINTATLFAVGGVSAAVDRVDPRTPDVTLSVARPNPFATGTWIRFSMARPAHARLEIVDAAGRRVAVLLEARLPAGEHGVRWEPRASRGGEIAAGVYFARLIVGDRAATARVVFTK